MAALSLLRPSYAIEASDDWIASLLRIARPLHGGSWGQFSRGARGSIGGLKIAERSGAALIGSHVDPTQLFAKGSQTPDHSVCLE
jgi:hypothetical protein